MLSIDGGRTVKQSRSISLLSPHIKYIFGIQVPIASACFWIIDLFLWKRYVCFSARETVRLRLVECGWRDSVKMICRTYLNDPTTRHTFDELIQYVTPEARKMVPAAIKQELLATLQDGLKSLNDSRKHNHALTENNSN